jgi:hypothetical protein
MAIPYEILIRGNNGAFQGAHAIDSPSDQPRAITSEDLSSLAPAINAASLAFVAGVEAEHAAAIAAKDAEIAQLQTDHTAAIAAKDAEIAQLQMDHTAAIASAESAKEQVIAGIIEKNKSAIGEVNSYLATKESELAQLQADYASLNAFKTAMEQQVSAVLQSGDPAQYEALAKDFLTPAEEKARAEKLARVAALKAEAAAIEAELKNP